MRLGCRNPSSWIVACSAALSLSFAPRAGQAQTASPTDEYRKLISAGQSIQPLGMHPFGESINLYNGSLSFEITDISVPGTGPTLQLSRALDTGENGEGQNFNMERPFGDWDLDIPHIETLTAFQTNDNGWNVANDGAAGALDRCTQFRAPPPVQSFLEKDPDWQPAQWWYGYHLIIPGMSDQYVGASGGSDLTPTVGGLTFPLGTKKDWRIACGVTASDGGEGFLAIAPDGTRYTFSYLVYRPATYVMSTTNPQDENSLERRDALMYVTKVQDRFGNTLTYNWSGNNLSSIVASDGRELDFTYNSGSPLVQTITLKAAAGASARTWAYTYGSVDAGGIPILTQVKLPDNSTWSYQLGNLQLQVLNTQNYANDCPNDTPFAFNTTPATGSMTAPSGLTATFTVTPMLHGRSYVPAVCLGAPANTQGSFPSIPNIYAQFSVTQEVLTGPGIPSAGWTWSWSYSSQTALNNSWLSDSCGAANDCPDTVYTDAQDPLGQVTRYTYSNRFDYTEGQLLSVDKYSGAVGTTELQSVANTYADPANEEWPGVGTTYMVRINSQQVGETSPLQTDTITLTQQNTSFSTKVNTFDTLARVTSKTESSSLGYSKTDTTVYSDDTTNWVLGSVSQTGTNGTTVSQTVYDSLDQPHYEYSFGRIVSTNIWNSDGTLYTTEDGDSNTTTFSNWYRGVPQGIAFADGTSQSAVVNGNGWITSVTDENGFATSYGYDAMGRVSSITYPSADDVAWNRTVLSFAPASDTEYGIAAAHWKQTVQTGDGYKVTYFDAFWRPLVTEHYDSGNSGGTLSQVVQQYDGDGHEVFTSYPTNSVSSYTQSLPGTHTIYDALDRVTEVDNDSELGTLQTITQYLSAFQTEVKNPRGYITTTNYQAYGEPDFFHPVSIAMPQGETTTISRDVYGKPLSITRSGTGAPTVARNYTYNSYQELCGLTEPETGTTALGYDGEANLAWSAPGMATLTASCYSQSQATTAGRDVTRAYDPRNRLRTVTYPDGSSSASFGYDPDGVFASQTDNNGSSPVTTTYHHDKRRLLTSEIVNVAGAWAFTLGYGHDANGHLAATTYPDQRIVSYAPNALGQPAQAGAYATGATYYPDGAVESYTFGNGLVHDMTENTRELPSRVTDAYGGTAVHDDGYDYDPDADVASITDYTTGSIGDRNMTYDGLDRLLEADSPMFGGDDRAVYTYDALDNLLTARVGSGTGYGYVYGGLNRLAQLTNATTGAVVNSYTYNTQGDLATKNSQTYQFDMADRLRSAPGLGSYLYDAAGRRVQKTEAVTGRLLDSMYSETGQLVFQWEPATQNGTDYIYLGDSLVARVIGNNSNVIGNIDGAPTAASPNVGGWACSTGLTQSITVELFVGGPSGGGGTLAGSYTASQPSEPAVATSCDTNGANYRFSIPLATATRSQDAGEAIYMYGVSPVGNSNSELANSGVYIVPANAGAPAAPASISVPSSSSTGSITVSWSSSSGATSYVLQKQVNGGSWTQVFSGTATSTAFSGLANGSYAYRVQACNSAGCSIFITSSTLTVALIPAAPASISVPASSYNASFAVSWASSANASSYTLQQSANGGAWGTIYTGSATSYTVIVSATGTYKYQVAACSAAGCSGYTVSGNVAVTLPPSSAPSLSGPASSTSGTYTLTWTTVSGATRYQLNQTLSGTVTTPYNGSSGSWSSSSLGDGTYDYQVSACNAGGCGSGSNVLAVQVLLVPGAPSYVTAPRSVNYPGNSWSLAIAPVAGASSYNLRRTDTSTGAATVLSNVGNDPTDYIYQGVYQYAGQACNASGCSGWTNAGNTTTVVCKPPSGGALRKSAAGAVRPELGCQ